MPSQGAIDLTRIIQQVTAQAEAEVGMFGIDLAGDISDDVRSAVRQALAEIEAATRPAVTDGLSVASLLAVDAETPDEADSPTSDGLRISLPR